jgi:hypothetical protein
MIRESLGWLAVRIAPAFLGVIAAGCGVDPGTLVLAPSIFPNEGRLGDRACAPGCKGVTVGISVDSNFIPLGDSGEDYGLATGDIAVRLYDPNASWHVDVPARAVFTSPAYAGSAFAAARSGAWVAVALFDLPNASDLPALVYPKLLWVQVLKRGVPSTVDIASFTVTGEGGKATTSITPDPALDLRSRPAIRLRPVAGSGAFPTGPSSPLLGSLEFEIEYPAAVAAPIVYPGTEAALATAITGPGSETGRTRVVVVDPKGFRLSAPQGGIATSAGEGPLLDVVFATKTGPFQASEIRIWKLMVTDVDGNTVIDRRSTPPGGESTSLFTLVPVANQ